jgi:hypothetical protein
MTRKKELELKLNELLSGSKEAYRLHLEAIGAGYSIRLVQFGFPGSRAAAKKDLAKLLGAA